MRSFSGWQRALLFAGTFSLAFVLAACGGGGNAASGGASTAGTPSAGAPSADRNAALRVAVNYTFSLYAPHRVVRAADTTYLRPVYDSLLTVVKNASGTREPGPRLTTSYVVAPDGLSIEFVLRENVTFQDGTPFNAAAVQANIERAQGPDSTVASKLKSIKTIEVRDPTHVVFQLSEPDPTLPWTMATDSAGMMVSPAAFNTDLATTPVGAGPFTLVSATKDADSVYKRWDGYWDKDAALVQSLTISSIADGNVRLNGLRSGQFDLVSLLAPQDYQAQSLQGEGYHYLSALGPTSYGVLLNSAKPPFNDVRVRRAVSMSVNRTEQSTQLTHGLYPPAYQAFNPGVLGHDPSLNNDPYNPDEARRLVQEAGADGASITVIQSLYQPADQLAQVVQQALGDIGLHGK